MKNASAKYRALPGDEDKTDFTSAYPADSASNDVSPSAGKILPHIASRRRQNISKVLPWLIHILLFVFSICTGVLVSRTSQEICQSEKTDTLLGARQKPTKVRFDGSFGGTTAFKGSPSLELDQAWDKILQLRVMSIPESLFQTLNVSKASVEIPSEIGSGRLAIFDTIHHLHCVHSMWKLAYPSYYGDAGGNNSASWSEQYRADFFDHHNHCADILRQKLMCDASSALVMYNWVEGHFHPHPNFNVEHKCRNYDELISAAKKYAIMDLPVEGFFRPKESTIVDFEAPPFDPAEEGRVVYTP